MKPKTIIDKQIESMVASEVPAANVVRAAIAAESKAREDREIEKVRQQLRTIESNTQTYVQNLRSARAKAKVAEGKLRAVLKAAEDFKATGDCAAYDQAMQKVRSTF